MLAAVDPHWLLVGVGTLTLCAGWVAHDRAETRRDAQVQGRLQAIEEQLKPNGLNTDQVGDIAKRTERSVGRLAERFEGVAERLDRHLGYSEAKDAEFDRRLADLERGHP